jgi:hypothetical protein
MLKLLNSGTVKLSGFVLAPAQAGCVLADLDPGAEGNCTIAKVVSQEDFLNWDLAAGAESGLFAMSVSVKATAVYDMTPSHNRTTAESTEATARVALPLTPSLTLLNASKAVSPDPVMKAGKFTRIRPAPLFALKPSGVGACTQLMHWHTFVGTGRHSCLGDVHVEYFMTVRPCPVCR